MINPRGEAKELRDRESDVSLRSRGRLLTGKTGLGPGTWMRSGNCVDICGEICSILDEVHIGAMGN